VVKRERHISSTAEEDRLAVVLQMTEVHSTPRSVVTYTQQVWLQHSSGDAACWDSRHSSNLPHQFSSSPKPSSAFTAPDILGKQLACYNARTSVSGCASSSLSLSTCSTHGTQVTSLQHNNMLYNARTSVSSCASSSLSLSMRSASRYITRPRSLADMRGLQIMNFMQST
jgi:hypothetical protein